jgi:hypothetical protein
MGAEKLVSEVPVAMLQVYEVETNLVSEARRFSEGGDNAIDLRRIDRVHCDGCRIPGIQDGMVIHDDGFKTRLLSWPAEPPGVSKLQADQEVIA